MERVGEAVRVVCLDVKDADRAVRRGGCEPAAVVVELGVMLQRRVEAECEGHDGGTTTWTRGDGERETRGAHNHVCVARVDLGGGWRDRHGRV